MDFSGLYLSRHLSLSGLVSQTCAIISVALFLTRDLTVDVILGLAWFAAFGVLVDALEDSSCWYGPWEAISWDGRTYLSYNSSCARWKAAEAFSFLSAVFWLASGLVVSIFCFRRSHSSYLCRMILINHLLQGIWFVFRVRSARADAV